jgi:tryptophan synthase alpha chain
MKRFSDTFAGLSEKKEGAFMPFTVLGDPTEQDSLQILRTFARSGADMLELGIPFSDPVADGPTIQKADLRALAAGGGLDCSWRILRTFRNEFPEIPLGLLVYANLIEGTSRPSFFAAAREAGVDAVLIADVPTLEIPPFLAEMEEFHLDAVLIAASNTPAVYLKQIARQAKAFTYVVTRTGVTGADERIQPDQHQLIRTLRELSAPPVMLGFGISRPEHVRQAIEAGASGAICGSAIVRIIEEHRDFPGVMCEKIAAFVGAMKQATREIPLNAV